MDNAFVFANFNQFIQLLSSFSMDLKLFLDIIGWLGVAMILSAYALAVRNILPSQHPKSLALNIIGSFFMCCQLFYLQVWTSFAINFVWVLIGLSSAMPRLLTYLKHNK